MSRLKTIEFLPDKLQAQDAPAGKWLGSDQVCRLMNISKRSLQRYRSLGELHYERIFQKAYYKESDVLKFIERNFHRFRAMKKKKK